MDIDECGLTFRVLAYVLAPIFVLVPVPFPPYPYRGPCPYPYLATLLPSLPLSLSPPPSLLSRADGDGTSNEARPRCTHRDVFH